MKRAARIATATDLAYERRRSNARALALQHRSSKKARKAQENQTKRQHFGGVMWGFDPNAGLVSSLENDSAADTPAGCYMFPGVGDSASEYGVEEIDSLGRRSRRQWHKGIKWGIEFGGPGKEPKYEAPSAPIKRTNV